MAKQKPKFYVVWVGRATGVFDSWSECEAAVKGFGGAKYKGFPSRIEAEQAFAQTYEDYVAPIDRSKPRVKKQHTEPAIKEALAVDAACSGPCGPMEYQGVWVADGRPIFHFGPLPDGTNNVGEFLAIVHGLAYMKQCGCKFPIYSDSRNALLWVKNKRCNTKLEHTPNNAEIFNLIARAEKWLLENDYFDIPLLKWETKLWGEIPADFGRK
ncbi:MAG: ribonuclease H family protein [Paludibacteraceae bacterium]|nr:ribonuclease H family protein [Paludibacteraceae bacterium]